MESQQKLPEVHAAFDKLVPALHVQLDEVEKSINAEVEAAQSSVGAGMQQPLNPELMAEREERGRKVMEKRGKELDSMKAELGVVWIMLMRFSRRAEGLKPARGIFTKARKDKWCPWGVYEAAGEQHCLGL